MKPRLAASVSLVLLLLAAGFAAPPAAAAFTKPVNEDRTIAENESNFVNLHYVWPAEPLEIDLKWNSTLPIDVWLLDRAQFDHFDAGEPFTFLLSQSGTNGSIRTNVTAALQSAAGGSMYIAIEHGSRGATTPPANGTHAAVQVHVEGKLWSPDPVYSSSGGEPLWIYAIELSFLLIPVAIIALFLVRRVRRKARQSQIREELAAGNVVGERAVQAPETVRNAPLAPPPPRAAPPPAYGQPAYGAYGQPAYGAPPPTPAAMCRNCGAPRTSANAFCGHCGAPL